MRSAVIGFVGLFFSGLFPGCGESSSYSNEGEHSPEIRTEAQGLSTDPRTRVVQEASYAMTGDWNRYTTANWPDVDTLATFAYTSSDLGAWNKLLSTSRYSAPRYQGFFVSCMRTRSEGYLPYPYTKCSLDRATGFGSFEMPYYTCQGSCSQVRKMRGGQCKPFMNLVAYRSGQYQGANYAFKEFPSDDAMKLWSVAPEEMPLATYQNINEGDFLRLPYGHALIVVRKIPATKKVVVFDSNWIGGGDGNEVVGSHVLDFSGSGNSNLGNYRVLKCVYKTNGRC